MSFKQSQTVVNLPNHQFTHPLKIDFTVLGTGSANPQLNRNPSAYLISMENEYVLIDCGEGTQYRLLEHHVKHTKLRHILISHLHGDHYFGLIGLLSSLNLNRRTEPMTLIGPPGLDEILTLQFKHSQTALNFPVHFIETDPTTSGVVYEHPLFSVTNVPLVHRVPCNGYVITTKPSLRKMRKDKMPDNFPVPYIVKLKNGEDVTDELTGYEYKVSEMTTSGKPPKKIAYCSDTAYYEGVIPIVSGADLLFHEATFTNENEKRAEATFHSTARQAAIIAQKANVKTLVIGHYSSRYKETETHLAEAKEIFENTILGNEGLTLEL